MSKLKLSAQEGRALALTLIALAVGCLLIPPFLAHASTNLLAARATEDGMKGQYAADAGVEYAIRRIIDGDCPESTPFDTPTLVNGMPVTVTVTTIEGEVAYTVITSTATSPVDGSNTTIESRVEIIPGGNLDIFSGALVSQSVISLKKDCTVIGDIYYEENFTYQEPFEHDGDEIAGGREWPTQEENEEFAERYKDEAKLGGTWSGDTYQIPPEPTDLGPKYIDGNLDIGKNTVVSLEGVIYVEGSIDVDMESEFIGSGSIFATGDIYLSKMDAYGTEGNSIIMSLTGNVTFKKVTGVQALIYAPNGTIQFDKDAVVYGGAVGGYIQSDKDGTFTYNADYDDWYELPGYNPGEFEVKTYNIK